MLWVAAGRLVVTMGLEFLLPVRAREAAAH
jgi:hypothetical protein